MKIKAILEQKPTVSFEVFPPKQWDKIEGTKAVVKDCLLYTSPSPRDA